MTKQSHGLFLFSALMLLPALAHGQFEFQDTDLTGTILPALQAQVRKEHGDTFNVFFVVLDSMIGNAPIPNTQEAITDPYGTLKNSVFFWAVPDQRDPENRDSVVVGMFKSGSIIWSTPPIYKGGITQIYAALDLNRDGDVDLVTFWSPSSIYGHSTDIRIFSWNGSTGRLISDYDPVTGETNLMTTASDLKLVKTKRGIYNLRAYWTDQEDMKASFPGDPITTRPWVTYRWDGTKYKLVRTKK